LELRLPSIEQRQTSEVSRSIPFGGLQRSREMTGSQEPHGIADRDPEPQVRLLIQVVPQLKPERCGVSDHAIALARKLESGFRIRSAFAVLNSGEKCNLPYSVVYCAPDRLLASCVSLSAAEPAAILVHLSGYGYSSDGAPAELAKALAAVRGDRRFRLAVFFHELFATGMPWTSAFWHSHRQQKTMRAIAEQCELILANTQDSFAWLKRTPLLRQGASLKFMPVFSTIGEAASPTPFVRRQPAIAVFGLPASRQSAFKALSRLAPALRALHVQQIVDIGMGFDAPPAVDGIPVRQTGMLAAADLANELSKTMFGFLTAPWWCLTKSSIFAAYCAQGTIPFLDKPLPGVVDGLEDGVHVLSEKTFAAALSAGLDRCSLQAWRWHAGHALHEHAAVYALWLAQPSPELAAHQSAPAAGQCK
jgi:hypothetical protein